MSDAKDAVSKPAVDPAVAAAASERAMSRLATIGVPTATALGALGVAIASGPGPALLVLAGGAIIGVVMLLWTSIRTLSGDAPLEPELALAMVAHRVRADGLAERKRMALRALKDLEHEHAVGKIDDVDYTELAARLRDDAKNVLREMDHALDDRRVKAEELARAHLARVGLADGGAQPAPAPPPSSSASGRVACAKCSTSNEPDATFCKSCGASVRAKETPADAP